MPGLFQHRIYRQDLRANPGAAYIFGDNEARVGYGGQAAEMRGEANAIGVATLKAPGRYWSDDDFAHNCAVIDADLRAVEKTLAASVTVVMPLDGFGTGFAHLEENAPRTFEYLQERLRALDLKGNAA